jgi:integrase
LESENMAAQRALTKLIVERIAPEQGRDLFVWDNRVPGFGVRVYPSGKRMYVFQYRSKGGRQRRVAIGLHGPFTVEKARDAAADLYEAVRKGRDPVEEQKTATQPDRDAIEHVIEDFMSRYMAGKGRSRRYIEETKRNFDKHVLPRWRGRALQSITRRDVIDLLDNIVDEGKPIAANRTLAAVRKLFNWALQRGIIEASPVTLVEMPGAERKRERTLDADEIRAVWAACGGLDYPFGHFFRMALVTGQRRDEVAQMRAVDANASERIWTLSSDMTKPRRAHVVPLSPLALDILGQAREAATVLFGEPEGGEPGTYVFTTRRDRPISGYSKAKGRLDRLIAVAHSEAGLPDMQALDHPRSATHGRNRFGQTRRLSVHYRSGSEPCRPLRDRDL